jgi:HK97 family phage prohead protease
VIRLRGYFAVWRDEAQIGAHYERFAPGAFQNSTTRLVCSHDARPGAAYALAMPIEQDEHGARFSVDLDDALPDVRRLIASIRSGAMNNASFAFTATKSRWDGDCQIIEAARLHEVSVAGNAAAYRQTGVWIHGDDLPPRLAALARAFRTSPVRQAAPPAGRRTPNSSSWSRAWAGAYAKAIGAEPDALRARVRAHMRSSLARCPV